MSCDALANETIKQAFRVRGEETTPALASSKRWERLRRAGERAMELKGEGGIACREGMNGRIVVAPFADKGEGSSSRHFALLGQPWRRGRRGQGVRPDGGVLAGRRSYE